MRAVQHARRKSKQSAGFKVAYALPQRKRICKINILQVFVDNYFDYIDLYRLGMLCFESCNKRHVKREYNVVLCCNWGERGFMDVYKPAPVKARFIAVFIRAYADVFDIWINADNQFGYKKLHMGVRFCAACDRDTDGAFLCGNLFIQAFFQRNLSKDGGDFRICRQFQRMRRDTARGIFIQIIFYFMVGDSVRMLRRGHDCAGCGVELGFLERRSEKEAEDVKKINFKQDWIKNTWK